MKRISLVLPINGTGSRFIEYSKVPKPLIKVADREMIFWLLDNIDLKKIEKIIIPYNSVLDHYDFKNKIQSRYPYVDFKLISLAERTSGAVETISIALDRLLEEELESNFMIIDCDTFYHDDVIEMYNKSPLKNAIFYSLDYDPDPLFSYITIKGGIVAAIKEKQKISNFANCGIFCIESGHTLKKYCSMLLSIGLQQKNEFYTSGIFDLILKDNIPVGAIKVENFKCVGTPLQLEKFLRKNNAY